MDEKILEAIRKEMNELRQYVAAVTATGTGRKVMTLPQAAAYLNLSPRRLYQLTHEHKITYYRNGGRRIWFDRNDLDEFCKGQRVATDNELMAEAASHTPTATKRSAANG